MGNIEIHSSFGCDRAIAAQSIMPGAAERGLGGCIIGSLEREDLREVLDIPDRYEILLAQALGTPSDNVVVEEVGAGGGIKYCRDAQDIHHVPERPVGRDNLRRTRRLTRPTGSTRASFESERGGWISAASRYTQFSSVSPLKQQLNGTD